VEFNVLNRWSGNVQFTANIECAENACYSFKLGLAVKWANLTGANLSGANLSDANLSDANLSGANLRGANLSDANLSDANLSDADLRCADLSDANLSDANLRGANLSDANLRGANLSDANLRGANLSDANPRDANLRGANNAPVVIHWLPWTTYVYADFVVIGCQKILRSDIETWGTNDDIREQWKKYFPFKTVIIAVWEYAFPLRIEAQDQP
jgi:Pentapeptide repeats (8 copies)